MSLSGECRSFKGDLSPCCLQSYCREVVHQKESLNAVLLTKLANIQEYLFKLFALKEHTGSVELLWSRDQSQFNCMAL